MREGGGGRWGLRGSGGGAPRAGETSQAALMDGSEGNIRAKGFSSRCFNSRRRRTASSLCAATMRWKPPRPFTATIWPWRMASAAADRYLRGCVADVRGSGGVSGAQPSGCRRMGSAEDAGGSAAFALGSFRRCCSLKAALRWPRQAAAFRSGPTTPVAGRRRGRRWAGRGSGGRAGRCTRPGTAGHMVKRFIEVFARS